MFDFDGDGDIDEFDEEMTEYELQLLEDEMFFDEERKRQSQKPRHRKNSGKSCGQAILIAIVFLISVLTVIVSL